LSRSILGSASSNATSGTNSSVQSLRTSPRSSNNSSNNNRPDTPSTSDYSRGNNIRHSTDEPGSIYREKDVENFFVFDPTNAEHVEFFAVDLFNHKQVLPSPPGVKYNGAGNASAGSPQSKFQKIAKSFEDSLWGLDEKGAGASYHTGTSHYNAYICRTWVAGGGTLGYVVAAYLQRYQKHKKSYQKKAKKKKVSRPHQQELTLQTPPVHERGRSLLFTSPPRVPSPNLSTMLACAPTTAPSEDTSRPLSLQDKSTILSHSPFLQTTPALYPSKAEAKRSTLTSSSSSSTSGREKKRKAEEVDDDSGVEGSKSVSKSKKGKRRKQVRITQREDKHRLIQAVCFDDDEKGAVVHGVITAFTKGMTGVTVWVCELNDDNDDGHRSYTLLKTASNNRWCMKLPMWSVVYKYKAKWNGKNDEPKVEGIVRNSDVTAAAEAAEDFDWDEFKHEGDGKSDSKTNVDSGDEELE
jgi:hypothetical protein